MQRVQFTLTRGGRSQLVPIAQAKALQRAGYGTYEDRSMQGRTAIKALSAAPQSLPASQSVPDGLGALDKDQLHALAKERGVKVHHAAGADKVRAALRDAK